MRGHVLDFSVKRSSGIISGSDGQRYAFTADDWNADQNPSSGMHVDFDADGREAKSIYVLPVAPAPEGAVAAPSSRTHADFDAARGAPARPSDFAQESASAAEGAATGPSPGMHADFDAGRREPARSSDSSQESASAAEVAATVAATTSSFAARLSEWWKRSDTAKKVFVSCLVLALLGSCVASRFGEGGVALLFLGVGFLAWYFPRQAYFARKLMVSCWVLGPCLAFAFGSGRYLLGPFLLFGVPIIGTSLAGLYHKYFYSRTIVQCQQCEIEVTWKSWQVRDCCPNCSTIMPPIDTKRRQSLSDSIF